MQPINRNLDVLCDILDTYTGEYVTFTKVTTYPATIDGIIYYHYNGEYFRRNYTGPINVKWFGATGDGITDDTLAIQAATNYGEPVYFPAGGDMCLSH